MNPDAPALPVLTPLDVEAAVAERYSAASRERSADLCCPVSYDARYLEVLPREPTRSMWSSRTAS